MNYLSFVIIALVLNSASALASPTCVDITGTYKAEFTNFSYANEFKQTGCSFLKWKQSVDGAKGWDTTITTNGVWTQPGYEGSVHKFYLTQDSLVIEARHQHDKCIELHVWKLLANKDIEYSHNGSDLYCYPIKDYKEIQKRLP